MAHALDCKIPGGRTVADVVLGPLLDKEVEPTIVDVGARNGMHQYVVPNAFASKSAIVGFEANPEEYEKLVSHTTDAQKVGAPMCRFKRERYFNCALWDTKEKRPFYITAGAGACTLMGEADQGVTSRMWLVGDDKPYSELHTDVRKTTPVDCDRLDNLLQVGDIVDILKIDVEGAEFAVLKGAEKLLASRSILFIKTEFVFTSYYENHPVLGYQHVLLHEHGFRLLDLDFDQAKYSRARTRIPVSADHRLAYAGDAYFMLDPDRNSLDQMTLHRMGVVCLVFGFSSLGISLMQDAALLSQAELNEIESAIAGNWTIRRLKYIWAQLPHRLRNIFR